ncbi:hypothetical protein NC651_034716 [Populus alba x Populus x berolinensis]|nr:hypothetical protein NC651_034716 [Populus alba x Populus x berolinensis]
MTSSSSRLYDKPLRLLDVVMIQTANAHEISQVIMNLRP